MHTAQGKTARAGAHRQGAVLLEGLLVSSTLALFLAGVLFFHAVYSAKLSTLREARVEAWRQALPGCGGGLAGLVDQLKAVVSLTPPEEEGSFEQPKWLSDVGRGVGEPGAVSAQASRWLGSTSAALRTRRSLACNEYGNQTSNDSKFGALFQAVRDMIGSP